MQHSFFLPLLRRVPVVLVLKTESEKASWPFVHNFACGLSPLIAIRTGIAHTWWFYSNWKLNTKEIQQLPPVEAFLSSSSCQPVEFIMQGIRHTHDIRAPNTIVYELTVSEKEPEQAIEEEKSEFKIQKWNIKLESGEAY